MSLKFFAAVAATTLTLASPAAAALMSETTDFSSVVPSPDHIGTTDLGYNDLYGMLSSVCPPTTTPGACNTSGDGQDSVRFDVGAGQELFDLNVSMEGFGPIADYRVYITNVSGDLVGSLLSTFAMNSGGDVLLGNVLGAGTYELSIFGNASTGVAGPWEGYWGFYGETSAVSTPAVPLPAGMPLALTAIGALGFLGRRKAKRG